MIVNKWKTNEEQACIICPNCKGFWCTDYFDDMSLDTLKDLFDYCPDCGFKLRLSAEEHKLIEDYKRLTGGQIC